MLLERSQDAVDSLFVKARAEIRPVSCEECRGGAVLDLLNKFKQILQRDFRFPGHLDEGIHWKPCKGFHYAAKDPD